VAVALPAALACPLEEVGRPEAAEGRADALRRLEASLAALPAVPCQQEAP